MYTHFVEAAESVLSQSYDDVELVVIVDGTPEVYDRLRDDYGGHDDVRIHLNDENVGLLESRNTGAEVATGDVVAFIDDDAIADTDWVKHLVSAYRTHDVLAAGGRMTPIWVAGKPSHLPEEFYWLIGVTHRGFGDEGEVRNTFGSNISFRRDVFRELEGFDTEIGGRKGDKNLQGGETELCARLRSDRSGAVYYIPDAEVGHKVFEYRTDLGWLLRRAFWQGYSKRAMEVLVPNSSSEESEYLTQLVSHYMPDRLRNALTGPSAREFEKFVMLCVFTACVGFGYVYAFKKWR